MSTILLKRREKISLSNFIPYELFFDNKIILYDSANKERRGAIVYKIQPFNYQMTNDQQKIDFRTRLKNFVNSLPHDIYMQIIWKKHQYYNDLIDEHIALNKTKERFIQNILNDRVKKIKKDIDDKGLFRIEAYVILSKKISYRIDNNILTSIYRTRIMAEEKFVLIKKELEEIEDTYYSYLKRANLKPELPSEQEVKNLCASQISGKEIREVKGDTKEDLIFADFTNYEEYFTLTSDATKYVRAISFKMKNFPEYVYPTLITYLLRKDLPFVYDIITNIKKLDKSKEIPQLKLKRNTNKGMKVGWTDNVDPEKEENEKNATKLIKSMISNTENMFNFELVIIIKSDSKEELDKNVRLALAAIAEMQGAVGYAETHANFRLWHTSFPGCGRFINYRHKKLYTSYIIDLLPVFGPPPSTSEPIFLIRNEFNTITYFNPLSDTFQNRNGLIFAGSGAGKSFTVNNIIMNILPENPIIIIIDVGGSYKKQIKELGGRYCKVSSKYSIDLFKVDVAQKETYWENIIQCMLKDPQYPFSRDEKMVIREAVSNVNQKTQEPIIEDFIEALNNLNYTDQDSNLAKDRMARYLKQWTTGLRGQMFNTRENNFDSNHDFLCIDLKSLKAYPDILEVFLMYITNICWQKMAIPERKKLVIFDEAWDIMATEQGAAIMRELYRTARKEHGAVISISQALTDFTNSKYSDDIMSNLAFYYILRQGDIDFSVLQKVFQLTEKQLFHIKNLHIEKGFYSEIFIKTPETSFVGKLVSSPLEYWYSTTDPKDMALLQQSSANKDFHQACLEVAAAYPNGVYSKEVNSK